MNSGTTEISVKLTTRGKYLWTITSTFPTTDKEQAVEKLKSIDKLLKDAFPNYVMQGSGRVAAFKEE
jgi:hypothetical protein